MDRYCHSGACLFDKGSIFRAFPFKFQPAFLFRPCTFCIFLIDLFFHGMLLWGVFLFFLRVSKLLVPLLLGIVAEIHPVRIHPV